MVPTHPCTNTCRGGPSRLDRAVAELDNISVRDPRSELVDGRPEPKELLYARRMSDTLARFAPDASEELKLAARAQHLARWQVPRSTFAAGREGYLKWRTELMVRHAELAGAVLRNVGYDEKTIRRVGALLRKEGIKRDPDVQTLEDVACLVFLRFYFSDFATQHDDGKLVRILRKTWRKMSVTAREAAAASPLDARSARLLELALGECG